MDFNPIKAWSMYGPSWGAEVGCTTPSLEKNPLIQNITLQYMVVVQFQYFRPAYWKKIQPLNFKVPVLGRLEKSVKTKVEKF